MRTLPIKVNLQKGAWACLPVAIRFDIADQLAEPEIVAVIHNLIIRACIARPGKIKYD